MVEAAADALHFILGAGAFSSAGDFSLVASRRLMPPWPQPAASSPWGGCA
jgi:hypothetical protein